MFAFIELSAPRKRRERKRSPFVADLYCTVGRRPVYRLRTEEETLLDGGAAERIARAYGGKVLFPAGISAPEEARAKLRGIEAYRERCFANSAVEMMEKGDEKSGPVCLADPRARFVGLARRLAPLCPGFRVLTEEGGVRAYAEAADRILRESCVAVPVFTAREKAGACGLVFAAGRGPVPRTDRIVSLYDGVYDVAVARVPPAPLPAGVRCPPGIDRTEFSFALWAFCGFDSDAGPSEID